METKNLLFSQELELTIETYFSAAHSYHREELDEEENRKLFGEYYSIYPHGHNYKLIVSVRGTVNPKDGMIINFHHLEEKINAFIMRELHYTYLNLQVEYFRYHTPTTEHICLYLWGRIGEILLPLILYKIRLYEDETLYVECKYDDEEENEKREGSGGFLLLTSV
ncbi:MAG: hypothetical protein A2Y62_10135 [Candidatus Fischerbacteria bacterium RBG_13_37_8]|uniref:6-carboxy-5,6,7,8-tetrahydropterin synthase n=1 Tax=Candidatus Fischerbacteria bacterium RBG_13_37_8 TaxID=1817863 RepID=A0A1F5V7D4_9BACT|nr:MAG: hypothetical protein A2Y62_10135 [Candidatus Fischerbacteria bacterium RBG_13_37_8]